MSWEVKNNKWFFGFIVVLLNFMLASPVSAGRLDVKKSKNQCTDSEFGIKFYCETDWKWRRVDDAILIIISDEPTVTFTITKVNSPIRFISQLTPAILKETELYADGFGIEHEKIADQKAIHVKAFSKFNNDVRLSDYYYVHHNSLYGALFSVSPKSAWDEKKFVIEKIRNTIELFD